MDNVDRIEDFETAIAYALSLRLKNEKEFKRKMMELIVKVSQLSYCFQLI